MSRPVSTYCSCAIICYDHILQILVPAYSLLKWLPLLHLLPLQLGKYYTVSVCLSVWLRRVAFPQHGRGQLVVNIVIHCPVLWRSLLPCWFYGVFLSACPLVLFWLYWVHNRPFTAALNMEILRVVSSLFQYSIAEGRLEPHMLEPEFVSDS